MNEYLLILIRIITIMLLLLFTTLLIMGKRPIGELPVFDFLAIIVMGAIVGADIADPKIKHLPTAFAVVVLAIFQRLLSYWAIKNNKVRKAVTFEPTIIVQDGQFIHHNLKKINYSVEEALMLLREKDVFDVGIVKYAIIEASGNLSVLKKALYEPMTKEDMHLSIKETALPVTVILEGQLNCKNIARIDFTEDYVLKMLKQKGYTDISKIFFASMDHQGNISISPYDLISDAIE
ncbi:MAG: hypothetical protein K0R93_426 [Anaerosolibacter sp.]|jgi:uncharacterized membrane protein YcaP (DUF421 family)|uniref:YetF domain-containing protein n=1 Tax=Anaerosolibacter sp. TaxID=1872527 RepID=UPI002620DD6F|nr:DUF421 domain-containing protein [Anaerosolibacter sp.]MDF2545528.1 hypothetical protein [Anaerosolibacter sp.]